jgi:hypothetical protein
MPAAIFITESIILERQHPHQRTARLFLFSRKKSASEYSKLDVSISLPSFKQREKRILFNA